MNTLRLFIFGNGASTVPGVSTKFNIDINDERNIKAIDDLVSNPGPNPRTSDLNSSVASGIRKSIATNPFYGITTHGCDAVVESFRLGHNEKGEAYCDAAFDFEDEDSGQFNGAHNLWLVLDYMRETIKTNPGQFLPAHFILSSNFESKEQIRQMAQNKNRQVGIDAVSELNVLGYFEGLKARLTPDLIKYMAWEQNEKQVGSSTAKKLATVTFKEALQILELTMYHYPSYSPKEKKMANFHPEASRKKIGSAPVEYFDPESSKTLAMAKTFGITSDLLQLRDHVVSLLSDLGQKDKTLIILRNLAASKESDPAMKFKAVLGGKGKTTVRTTGYFSKPDTVKYSTCLSFHRLFLFWFVKKCFKVCPETDELVYRDSWDYDLMVKFMDSSCERVARALEGLYRASWAENSMTEENWLIQKYVNASVFQKPFQMADEQFDNEYALFIRELPDQNIRRTLKRVEKASNG